jgi:TonB family protein
LTGKCKQECPQRHSFERYQQIIKKQFLNTIAMKMILSFIVIIFPSILFGQTNTVKIFLNEDFLQTDSVLAKYTAYLEFFDAEHTKLDGISKTYYSNGQLLSSEPYHDNKYDGELTSYFPSGKLRRKDFYENGTLVKGNCYTEFGEDTLHYDFKVFAKYPGSDKALLKYISSNIKYPKKSKRQGIYGKVFVNFVINKNGEVINVKVVKSVDPLLDNEAKRVIENMSNWTPGLLDGKVISIQYTIPINFTLY